MAEDRIPPINEELKEQINAQFKTAEELLDKGFKSQRALIEYWTDRINGKLDRYIAESDREKAARMPGLYIRGVPPDDGSVSLARAIERLAELQCRISLKSADLEIGEYLMAQDPATAAKIENSKQRLADLKAEKERAVQAVAGWIAYWKKQP